MKVAFGVVLFKTKQRDLDALLQSIIHQEGVDGWDYSIVIKSNDGESYDKFIKSFLDERPSLSVDIVSLPGVDNCGFGAGHNLLVKKSRSIGADYYIGCNPDGRLHPLAVSRFMRQLDDRSGRTLYEFRQFPQEHPKIYDTFKGNTHWVSGACFAISTKFYAELGGFDENIRMYCEDVDLSWRVLAEGGECVMLPSCLFYHDMSDQRARHFVRVEMLRAGRYLAWKWKSQGFQDIMEAELVRLGVGDEIQTLPKLTGSQVSWSDEKIHGIAEFRRMFSFSPTRW